MKNQNDWILSITFAVLAIGATVYFITSHRQPEMPPKPEPVPSAKLELPKGAVTYSVGLPGGGGGTGVATSGAGRAMPGGAPMGGPGGAPYGPPMGGPGGAPMMGGSPSGGAAGGRRMSASAQSGG